MAIDGRTLSEVRTALTTTSTTELDFRNAETSIANQVDANQVDINVSRDLTLTGDVTGMARYNLGDNAARNITIDTSIANMTIVGSDINDGTITGTQIATNTIDRNQISDSSKRRFRVLDPGGNVLFELDGLVPNA